MNALTSQVLNLCLLNNDPQDLPASSNWLAVILSVYFAMSVILALPFYAVSESILQGVIEIGLLMLYTRSVLTMRGYPERSLQTLIALAGTGIVFGLIALPLAYSQPPPSQTDETVRTLSSLAYFVLLCWWTSVYGHIFRHALSASMLLGVLTGFGYILGSSIIIGVLVPPTV